MCNNRLNIIQCGLLLSLFYSIGCAVKPEVNNENDVITNITTNASINTIINNTAGFSIAYPTRPIPILIPKATFNIKNHSTVVLLTGEVHPHFGQGNITILHEVHDGSYSTKKDRPERILPLKPLKKKSYTTIADKNDSQTNTNATASNWENSFLSSTGKTTKELDYHPVVFDFNLGDLEDLTQHETENPNLITELPFLLTNASNIPKSSSNMFNLTNTTAINMPTTTMSTTTTLATSTMASSSVYAATIGPHILKISKNPKSLKKGRELLQREDLQKSSNNHNSLYRYTNDAGVLNSSSNFSYYSENILQKTNIFQIVVNLFDHFYWQANEIKPKLSTGCALELQAYLTALHGNYHWAQKAYDASGRYRGQLLFGNDKWLGQKSFCFELNRQLEPESRKHFEFDFYTALINLRLRLPQPLELNLQLGECLPKSCSAYDVQHILESDPHALLLRSSSFGDNSFNNNESVQSSLLPVGSVRIQKTRAAHRNHNYWHELRFQIFISLLFTIIFLVIMGTWYQSKLNERIRLAKPCIAVISAKFDTNAEMPFSTNTNGNEEPKMYLPQTNRIDDNMNLNEAPVSTSFASTSSTSSSTSEQDTVTSKRPNVSASVVNAEPSFELYQLTHLNETQNVLDCEMDDKNSQEKVTKNNTQNQNQHHQLHHHHHHHHHKHNYKHNYHSTIDSDNFVYGLRSNHQKVSNVIDYRTDNNNTMPNNSNVYPSDHFEVKQRLSLHEQLLLCFAFQTNASAILNVEINKEKQTTCLHGLRVISVLWTIMVHTYLQMFSIAENRFTRIIVERSPWYQIIGNATFSVDTFFFISGFLVTLIFLRQSRNYPENTVSYIRKGITDTLLLLLYRYIRLTPVYLFVIFFNDFALRYTFQSAVIQPTVDASTCQLYWWRNIFYINNFYPLKEICMIWSWYMANEMQFYILAILMLTLAARYAKMALLTMGTCLISSWGVSGIVSLRYHYTHKVSHPFESFDFLYDKPWQRVGPYIMGMLAGCLIYKVRTRPRISSGANLLLWLFSLGLLGFIIFGVWQGQLDEVTTAFYVSIGHTAFGIGLLWMVLSCCWGLSPTMNRILSYPCLWPLSRLTYCAYLIHPVIMLISAFRMHSTANLTNILILTIFLGNAVVSFVAAFFMSVLFEAPIIRLLKIIFRK